MNGEFDICPYCGRKLLRGAMRCPGCGNILKTPEEQAASIDKLKKSREKVNVWGYIKGLLLLAAAGIIYYFFSDKIIDFIQSVLNR